MSVLSSILCSFLQLACRDSWIYLYWWGVQGSLFCCLDRLSVFAFEFLVDDVHRTGDSDLRIRKLA